MRKRNNTYWEDRANLRMASYHKDSDSTIQKISNAYDNAIRDINSDIENIVNNYKLSGDLSDKELRRLLNTKIPNPIRKMMKRILPRIKNEDIRKYLISRLNAEAYKTRITRLEALKESCYLNSKLVADVELRESTKLYMNTIKKAYYTNSFDIQKGLGIGFNVAQMPDSTIQEILKNNWSGKHYSDRIWANTDILANKLEEIITSGLMSGKSSRRMAKELQDMANCSKFAAERLIRTETTYISNMAEMESYKEDGIDKYVFVATLDLRTSSVCREHDGKVYKVDEAISGENMPPLHPHCRSTTIAYLGEETLKNIERRARDPVTGKTYKVPADMNYQEWYDKFVVDRYGKDKTEAMEKMIKNKASDKNQLKRYQDILGKEAPKSLKEFQELKYNNSEEWETIKSLYRDVNWQIEAQNNIVKDSVHTVPFKAEPNSVFDNYKDGKLESRRYYGKTGKPRLDIDLTDHGNSKEHTVVPHYHDWYEIDDEKVKRDSKHDKALTKAHKIANKNILKGDD